MNRTVNIIGFTGSLRRNSYNKAALRAANELLPEDASLEIVDLSPIPFFNEDLESEGIPQTVVDFKKKLSAADAILIATPEYNYSIPPALKNALDWASRGKDLPLSGKPLAIMSASPSIFGGARVQYHLRQVCVVLNLLPLNKPEVFLMKAHTKFDQDGKLSDEYSRSSISKLLQALVDKTRENFGR
jgi:chromate reductase, NAD(P)H dehydrogenase (quinone)